MVVNNPLAIIRPYFLGGLAFPLDFHECSSQPRWFNRVYRMYRRRSIHAFLKAHIETSEVVKRYNSAIHNSHIRWIHTKKQVDIVDHCFYVLHYIKR